MAFIRLVFFFYAKGGVHEKKEDKETLKKYRVKTKKILAKCSPLYFENRSVGSAEGELPVKQSIDNALKGRGE